MSWQRLRIGLVGPLPPPAGGMANQTLQLRELLHQEGASVSLVQTNAPYKPAWVAPVRGLRALARLFPYVRALWRCAGEADVFHIMANSGWSWHLFAAPAIWIANARHVRVVVNYRGGEAERFLERSHRWVLPSLRRANVLVVPSAFLQQIFGRFGIVAEVVPNVIDVSRFHPVAGQPREVFHVVVARHLEPIYDIGSAIRAFALLRGRVAGALLSIAGSGPERAALERLAHQLDVRDAVTFTGQLDRDGMAELYRTASALLNPSLVDNMPNSLLEALASGVPVVSTSVGGIPYLVEHDVSALLTTPGDYAAMANALARLHEDPGLAARLRSVGLASIQRYAWPNVRDRWLPLYGAVAQAPKTSASVVE